MYAIVDIETTGGKASVNGITQIAIVLHDGINIAGTYETLVNPGFPIQPYVQKLTGITNKMVATAPDFSKVAPEIFELLKDKIFVAHNVNFDYSYVQFQLQCCGFRLDVPKLCTIRLSRKIFPGLPKYGLETICQELDIDLGIHHRADADAIATAKLFTKLIEHDSDGVIEEMLSNDATDPLKKLAHSLTKKLYNGAGLYYFYDQKGRLLYVGSALHIKAKVFRCFMTEGRTLGLTYEDLIKVRRIGMRKITSDLLRNIFMLIDIRRYLPPLNRNEYPENYRAAIYSFRDSSKRQRLALSLMRSRKSSLLLPFLSLPVAEQVLHSWIERFNLPSFYCLCQDQKDKVIPSMDVKSHNAVFQRLLETIVTNQPSFIVRTDDHGHFILFDHGRFFGIGKIPVEALGSGFSLKALKPFCRRYRDCRSIRILVKKYCRHFPERYLEIV